MRRLVQDLLELSRRQEGLKNSTRGLEQQSAQLYLAMSAHCEGRSFRGFAHWLRVQASEETAHALKLVDFLLAKSLAAAEACFGDHDPRIGVTEYSSVLFITGRIR